MEGYGNLVASREYVEPVSRTKFLEELYMNEDSDVFTARLILKKFENFLSEETIAFSLIEKYEENNTEYLLISWLGPDGGDSIVGKFDEDVFKKLVDNSKKYFSLIKEEILLKAERDKLYRSLEDT